MNVLIVHAHPEPRSFTAAMRDVAIRTLGAAGHDVVVSDLYEMRFNPIASADDFRGRGADEYMVYALEQRRALAAGSLAVDIASEVEKLRRADLVIFSFPLFWFSVPAILKGWIDRVFLSGFAYGGKHFYDRGRLRGKRALLALTLGGQEHMFGPEAVHGRLEDMLSHILRGTLHYTGMTVLPPFAAYHIPYIDLAARERWLKRYAAYLDGIDAIPKLAYPTLDAFDDELRPIRGAMAHQ